MCKTDDDWNIVLHAVRGDATNASIWQRRKLHALEVESAFLDSCEADGTSVFTSIKRVADIQAVTDATGFGAVAMIAKQLASLGCPSISEVADTPALKGVHIYAYTSDRGPDQVYARKIMSVIAQKSDKTLFLSTNCFEHQTHLIVHGALKMLDSALKDAGQPWRYYSSLCKICNLWRDKAASVNEAWMQEFGAESACLHATKLIPRCQGGRWGSVETVEVRLDDAGITTCLHHILKLVLARDKKPKDIEALEDKGGPRGSGGAVVDELALEENQAYRHKMGKWSVDVLKVTEDIVFERLVTMMRLTRAPILHLSAFLKKSLSPVEIENHGGHLSQLACGKAKEIASEFIAVMASPIWRTGVLAPHAQLEKTDIQWLARISVSIVFYYMCAFHRRVYRPLNEFPYRLLKMCVTSHAKACKVRQAVAADLQKPHANLDPFSCKIKEIFSTDITEAVTSGRCGLRLWVTLRGLRTIAKADVRENERINKMIKLIGQRSPNCSLDLLSARVGLKHYLGAALGEADRSKFSKMKPVAEALLDTCLTNADTAMSVSEQRLRFEPPILPIGLPDKAEVDKSFKEMDPDARNAATPAIKWAAPYASKLVQQLKTCGVSDSACSAWCFGKPDVGATVWICSNITGNNADVLKCELQGNMSVKLVHPVEVSTILQVVSAYHTQVYEAGRRAPDIQLRRVPLKWWQDDRCLSPFEGQVALERPLRYVRPLFKLQKKRGRATQSSRPSLPDGAPAPIPIEDVPAEDDIDEEIQLTTEKDAESLAQKMLAEEAGDEEGLDLEEELDRLIDAESADLGEDIREGERVVTSYERRVLSDAMSGTELREESISSHVDRIRSHVDRICEETHCLPEDALREALLNDIEVMGNLEVLGGVVPDSSENLHCERVLTAWQTRARDGLSVLKQAYDVNQQDNVLGQDGCLSIVACPTLSSVCFVHWSAAPARLGRVADLWPDQRIKAIVNAVTPEQSFSDYTIVLKTTGVYMRRAKKDASQHMPDNWVALKRMWQLALNARFPSGGVSKCALCAEGDQGDRDDLHAGADSDMDDKKLLFCCALCATSWHSDCCDNMMRFARTRIADMPEYVEPLNFVPEVFYEQTDSDTGLCLGLSA